MHKQLIVKFIFLISFLLLGSFSQVQAQGPQVGVAVGDSFNFKITKNDFSSSSYTINLTELSSYYNFSQLNVDSNYDFNSLIDALNATLLPSVNDVFGVTVTQLPDGSSSTGALTFNYGSNSKDVLTGFMIGTPVTTLNWTYWHDYLYGLNVQSNEPSISPGVYQNSQTFNATLKLQYSSVPPELSDAGFSSLALDVQASYDKTTGVLLKESFSITLTYPSAPQPVVQSYSFERTTQSLTSDSNNKSLNGSGPVPGFEALALVSGFLLLTLYKSKRR